MNVTYTTGVGKCLLMLCATAALSGCMSAAEQTAEDRQTCAGYGFTEGSTEFANCMMVSDQRRKKAEADWQAEENKEWQDRYCCHWTNEAVDIGGISVTLLLFFGLFHTFFFLFLFIIFFIAALVIGDLWKS